MIPGAFSDIECSWAMWLDLFNEDCETPFEYEEYIKLAALDNGLHARLLINMTAPYLA